MQTLKLQLKRLKTLKLKKCRNPKPIVARILRMWLPELLNSTNSWYLATAMVTAYSHLLRAGEFTCSTKQFSQNPAYRLNWNDITIGYNQFDTPTIMKVRIKMPKSFSNKFKPEFTLSECTCSSLGFCALHLFLSYKQWAKPSNLSEPVFTNNGGKWLTPSSLTRTITNLCIKHGLDPEGYAPHGFRSGGCTDLKLKGTDDMIIQKKGRWASSNTWIKHYLLLDLFDVLRLSRC